MGCMNPIQQKSLLIVDDHPIYRDALREKLALDFEPQGIEVAVSSNADQGLELLEKSEKKWLVLLDILMPGLSGLAGIKVFNNLPNVETVIAISGLDEHIWEPKAISAGAHMFLSKNNTADYIIKKIKPLLQSADNEIQIDSQSEEKPFKLTPRQYEVLVLMAKGYQNKIIADLMDISEQTVKIHINQIFKEMKVFNRIQAVIKAQKNKLV